MLIYFFIGVAFGAILTYIVCMLLQQRTAIDTSQYLPRDAVAQLQQQLEMQIDRLNDDLHEKETDLRTYIAKSATLQQHNQSLQELLNTQKIEVTTLQTQFQTQFEQVANRLLEEKSERFSLHNQQQISNIVAPLRERLLEFEARAERSAQVEMTERVSLRKELELLRDLNTQLSSDALQLTNALKGDSKTQGDWGEFRLELLLEKSGLTRDIHFKKQSSFKDDEGKDKRPDFIVYLPDDKQLIIDSKVSLTAYEQWFNGTDDLARDRALRQHTESLRRHIRDLSGKRYEQLYQINSPDYLLLFVPIESAYSVALQNDPTLLTDALERNIVIVTTSTLLATLRTVAFIWKQEKQSQNVLEIARQSGKLYDKLVGFIEDLQSVGRQLDQAQTAYQSAFNKLNQSTKFGDTVIGRAERIRELGANATKRLNKNLTDNYEL